MRWTVAPEWETRVDFNSSDDTLIGLHQPHITGAMVRIVAMLGVVWR